MSTVVAAEFSTVQRHSRLKAVMCGSFRRDHASLSVAFDELARHFEILSPASVDFVDTDAEFVRVAEEWNQEAGAIEERHLQAMRSADLVWLHAPDGYVGRSASMELGYARALGIPVFCVEAPKDEVLSELVTVVPRIESIEESVLQAVDKPGVGLARLQDYYRTAAARRGWSGESARDTLLLLTEEMGELARAIRKNEGLARHHGEDVSDVAGELADVQLYLVHLANSLGLDLSHAVTAKELVNAGRFANTRVA